MYWNRHTLSGLLGLWVQMPSDRGKYSRRGALVVLGDQSVWFWGGDIVDYVDLRKTITKTGGKTNKKSGEKNKNAGRCRVRENVKSVKGNENYLKGVKKKKNYPRKFIRKQEKH